MTTGIVVSRRDGILRAPDGTKHRVARGKTLADADHPAVLANPSDWMPMVVELTTREAADYGDAEVPGSHSQVEQYENDLAELEETLAQRDAELSRLATGLEAAGIELPAEDQRAPGWLVDLALGWIDVDRAQVAKHRESAAGARETALAKLDKPASSEPAATPEKVDEADPAQPTPAIAPPKPRKRTQPPVPPRGQ